MYSQRLSEDSEINGLPSTNLVSSCQNLVGNSIQLSVAGILRIGAISVLLTALACGSKPEQMEQELQVSTQQEEQEESNTARTRDWCRNQMIDAANVFIRYHREHGTYEGVSGALTYTSGACPLGAQYSWGNDAHRFRITCPNGHGEIVDGETSW